MFAVQAPPSFSSLSACAPLWEVKHCSVSEKKQTSLLSRVKMEKTPINLHLEVGSADKRKFKEERFSQ